MGRVRSLRRARALLGPRAAVCLLLLATAIGEPTSVIAQESNSDSGPVWIPQVALSSGQWVGVGLELIPWTDLHVQPTAGVLVIPDSDARVAVSALMGPGERVGERIGFYAAVSAGVYGGDLGLDRPQGFVGAKVGADILIDRSESIRIETALDWTRGGVEALLLTLGYAFR